MPRERRQVPGKLAHRRHNRVTKRSAENTSCPALSPPPQARQDPPAPRRHVEPIGPRSEQGLWEGEQRVASVAVRETTCGQVVHHCDEAASSP